MSNIETFDDFDSSEQVHDYRDVKPFALREGTSKEKTLEWLNENFDQMEQQANSRLISYQRWNYLYKGIHWRNIDSRGSSRTDSGLNTMSERKPRMVDNFIKEFIDAKVSQMARFGTNFAAIPWNNEIADENVAKACDKLLKGRSDEMDFDKIQRDADRMKYKYGTVFIMTKWDKEQGPDLPAFKKLKEIYDGDIPKKIMKKLPNQDVKAGDVNVYLVAPDRLYPELGRECWEDVRHIDEVSWENLHEVRAEYPKLAKDILENQRNYYDYSTNEMSRPHDQLNIRKFYHPPSKFLPEGAYIKYCDSCILEWTAYPFKHGRLPFIVDRDTEIENELFGRPSIDQIEQMQRQYNNISSAQARDLGVGSAPKWMVPKGSADFRSINNEFTIVEFKGPMAPQLIKNNPISNDGILIQDRTERRMSKHMKVYDISRGEVPSGVTANSALRFLDEQESQVLADDERKRKKRVLKSYRMMIDIMAQYYTADDGRTLRTLGKNNEYMIEDMKKADFTKIYDVQFQNTSALPDTKTGKIAAIIDLNAATQTDPIFRREDIVNMLDMGTDETFTEETTFSLDCAKMVLQRMLEGEEVPEPEMHDDLLVFYSVMYRSIQSFKFKSGVPEEIKTAIYTYIKTIEGLVFLKMQRNQKLAMEVQMLSHYPCFFEPPTPEAPITADEAMVGAQQRMETEKMENAQKDVEAARTADGGQQ